MHNLCTSIHTCVQICTHTYSDFPHIFKSRHTHLSSCASIVRCKSIHVYIYQDIHICKHTYIRRFRTPTEQDTRASRDAQYAKQITQTYTQIYTYLHTNTHTRTQLFHTPTEQGTRTGCDAQRQVSGRRGGGAGAAVRVLLPWLGRCTRQQHHHSYAHHRACVPCRLCRRQIPGMLCLRHVYALCALARLSLCMHSSMRTLALALSVCFALFCSQLCRRQIPSMLCLPLLLLYLSIHRCVFSLSLSLSLPCSLSLALSLSYSHVPTSNTVIALSSLALSLSPYIQLIYPCICPSIARPLSLWLSLALPCSLFALVCGHVK